MTVILFLWGFLYLTFNNSCIFMLLVNAINAKVQKNVCKWKKIICSIYSIDNYLPSYFNFLVMYDNKEHKELTRERNLYLELVKSFSIFCMYANVMVFQFMLWIGNIFYYIDFHSLWWWFQTILWMWLS